MPSWLDRWLSPPPPPQAAPPQPVVSAPVDPRASWTKALQLCLGAGALVVFLVMWGRGDSPQDQGSKKTSGVSIEPPAKGLFAQRTAADESRMSAELARQTRELEDAKRRVEQTPGFGQGEPAVSPQQTERERLAEERRLEAKQERDRLWAARFAPGMVTVPEPAAASAAATPASTTPAATPEPPTPVKEVQRLDPPSPATERKDCVDITEAGRRFYAVCEGTILQARTQVRLNGDFVGPVKATLEQDVYSRDRAHLLFPAGTMIIGEAARVSQQYQQRLSVSFSRILFPNGNGYALNGAPALQRTGEVGLKDKVNNHVPGTIAAAVVMGGLAGFSQAGTGGVLTGNGIDIYRQGVASQVGQAGQQIVGQRLNRPPTLTITEGFAVEIWLKQDMHVPEYSPSVATSFGEAK